MFRNGTGEGGTGPGQIAHFLRQQGIGAAIAVRYGLAGATATGLNFGSRIALSQALPFELAVLGAQGIGFVAGFLLYRGFVFRDAGTALPRQIGAFFAVNLCSSAVVLASALACRAALLHGGMEVFPAEALAHAGGLASGALINFTGHRFLTFARRRESVSAR